MFVLFKQQISLAPTSEIKTKFSRQLKQVRTVGSDFVSAFVSMYRTEVVIRSFVNMIAVRWMEMDVDIE